jgi:hypothetical protein
MLEQPCRRRIAPIPPDRPHRPPRHRSHLPMHRRRIHLTRQNPRCHPHPPHHLIRHPVPHPRKHRLLQQQRLQRRPPPPTQKLSHPRHRETLRQHLRRQPQPPLRQRSPLIPSHPAKHPRIPEHQRRIRRHQHQMIMLPSLKIRSLRPQLPRHPKMHTQPPASPKTEQQLLPVPLHPRQRPSLHPRNQPPSLNPAKHPRPTMHPHRRHPAAQPRIPFTGIPLHFSKLRHTPPSTPPIPSPNTQKRRAGLTCPPRKFSEAHPNGSSAAAFATRQSTLGLITQTLLVAVSPHAFLALVLVDLRFPSLFERAHGGKCVSGE